MIIVSMAELVSASSKISSVAVENSSVDILKCINIKVKNNVLTMAANNLDIQAECSVKCEGDLQSFAVNASRFFAVIKTASKQSTATIDASDGRVKISAGRSKWDLPYLESDTFPTIKPDNFTSTIKMDSSVWKSALMKVKSAQSTNLSQYYLCGTYFHSRDGNMSLASTNGASVHIVETGIKSSIEGIIIPSQMVSTLLSSIPDSGDVKIEYNDRMMQFSWDGFSIVGKMADATFPDYNRIIPEDSDVKITVDVPSLMSAIAAVIPVADHKYKRCKITVQSDKIVIENIEQNSGIASSDLPASVEGFSNEFNFAINGVAMCELLSSIGCETAVIDNADNAGNMKIIKITPTVENGFFGCIAPMKL